MEATESPLDVLSRAATMVQDSSPPEYECATRPCTAGSKELPSSRWRRERREKGGGGYAKLRASHPPTATPTDTPLDMTTPRGLPPSYSQGGGRCARNAPRVSVITSAPPRMVDVTSRGANGSAGQRREQLCDPVIDEHFRRSLGNEYSALFDDSAARSGSRVTVTGLSVDDHFAKALGDTWTKLQKAEPEVSAPQAPPTSPPTSAVEATPPSGTANPGTAKLLPARRGLVTI